MAHRGVPARAPENTLAGFHLAIQAQAELLETDLWLTRDEQVVLHHDETGLRMTGDPRRIGALTLDEVRTLVIRDPAGRVPDQRVPTLEELVALAPPHVILTLELKDPLFAFMDSCRRVAELVGHRIAASTVLFVSFQLDRLHAMRRVAPAARIGQIVTRNPLPFQDVDMVGCYWPVVLMNPAYVAMAHRAGKWACILDERLHDHIDAYLRLGFDCVLSDDAPATCALLDAVAGPREPVVWGAAQPS